MSERRITSFTFEQQADVLRAAILPFTRGSGKGTALDVASGNGAFANLVKELLPSFKYVLLDTSRPRLLESILFRDTCIQGSGHNLPCRSASIDLVLCRQGLHYMNIKEALLEFHRVLTPTGTLILSNEWWLEGDEDEEELRWVNKVAASRNNLSHVLLSHQEIVKALNTVGFEIWSMTDSYLKYTVSVSEWTTFFGKLDAAASSYRLSLLKAAPPKSFARGYPLLINNTVTYASKWTVIVSRSSRILDKDVRQSP